MREQIQNIMKDLEGYLTDQQIEKVLSSTSNKRDYLLILIGYHTGRRISEILELKKGNIDFDKGLITWHILKKKDKQYKKIKPVDAFLLSELDKYTQNLQPEHYIFASTYNIESHLTRRWAYNVIRKAVESSGVSMVGNKPPHPHVLRHSFAINFLRKTKNKTVAVKILQEILEHSSITHTSTYLQFSQEDLRAELDDIFGGKSWET